MPDDTKSKIAELEKELYAKEFKPHEIPELKTTDRPQSEAPSSWDYGTEAAAFVRDLGTNESNRQTMKNLTKKVLIGSILFFLIALGIAAYVYTKGRNVVSGENIEVQATAPVSITGGEPFESKITILNDNSITIDSATLFFDFDKGFYNSENQSELTHVSQSLGSIASGQLVSQPLKMVLYGEENTEKTVRVNLEYRMVGSNAVFKKETSFKVKILSSPIILKLKAPQETASGQDVELSFEVESNSKDSLDGLLIEAVYPRGFTFMSADPSPTYGNNLWTIPSFASQANRIYKIRGTIQGQEGDEQVTKISVGSQSAKDERLIGVIFNSVTETFAIAKPLFNLNISVNGQISPEVSVPAGQGVRVDINWQNNDMAKITDAVIEATLKGEALDRYSVYATNGGFYRSTDNTIVWNKAVEPSLAVVNTGARGGMSFSFSPATFGADAAKILKNPQITVEVKARARRVSESSVSDDVLSVLLRKIRVETQLSLASRGLYYSGPFKNTGPMPPKAEQETTYTVVWTVRNTSSNISNASVRTILPVYVRWMNTISPSSESVTYSDSGADVVWNIGSVPAGGTREVAFQVALNPSISQIGQTLSLTGETVLNATDDFTKAQIVDRKGGVKTNLTSDPQFVQTEAAVVK